MKNTADTDASMVLTVDKNDLPSVIFPGIKRIVRLAPGETTDLYHTPNPKDELFEVQFELVSVYDVNYHKQSLSLLEDYVQVRHQSN